MHLQRNAVSALESTLISVAGTAPANTLATSTSTLIAAVGLSGPGALLFGAIPMFGIALSYYYLNRWRSDAGAAYAWVGSAVDPVLGFFAGWAMLVAQVLFMVVGSLPVADATLDVVAPSRTHDVALVTGIGLIWFLIVVGIVMLGIKTTARFQKVLTYIQIGGLRTIRRRRRRQRSGASGQSPELVLAVAGRQWRLARFRCRRARHDVLLLGLGSLVEPLRGDRRPQSHTRFVGTSRHGDHPHAVPSYRRRHAAADVGRRDCRLGFRSFGRARQHGGAATMGRSRDHCRDHQRGRLARDDARIGKPPGLFDGARRRARSSVSGSSTRAFSHPGTRRSPSDWFQWRSSVSPQPARA